MNNIFSHSVCAAALIGTSGTALAAWLMTRPSSTTHSPQRDRGGRDDNSGMAHFFTILPVDLQLCILNMWLSDGHDEAAILRVLSSLDIACGRALRAYFIALAGHPALIWNDFHVNEFTLMGVEYKQNTAAFMAWLQSRHVKKKYLFLKHSEQLKLNLFSTSPSPALLPDINTILITDQPFVGDLELLQALWGCFPNLTSVSIRGSGHWRPTTGLMSNTSLKRLAYYGSHAAFGEFMLHISPGLEELRLPSSQLRNDTTLIQLLTKNCETLQGLELNCTKLSTAVIVQLIAPCVLLSELVLSEVIHTTMSAMTVVAAASRSLKRFVLCGHACTGTSISYDTFADLLEGCPWVEYVQFFDCSFDHNKCELIILSSVFLAIVHQDVINRIAGMDLVVKVLEFSFDVANDLNVELEQAVSNLIASFGRDVIVLTLYHITTRLISCIVPCSRQSLQGGTRSCSTSWLSPCRD